MLTSIKHISSLSRFTVQRLLPVEGTVLVRIGQQVNPSDVVAEVILKPKYHIINAANILGVRNNELKKFLKRKAGEKISKDGILAEKEGLFIKEIRTPENCRLMAVSAGQLLLEFETSSTKVVAGVRGIVKYIEPSLGATIETTGVWIEGVWGNGKTGFGILNVIAENPKHDFAIEDLDVNMRGAILFAGHCGDEKALQFADEIGIRGLVFGSMSSNMIPVAKKMSFPIVVLDGFGRIAMDPVTFKMIATNNEREICLVGDKKNRYTGEIPLVTIPLPTSIEADEPVLMHRMMMGSRVRVINCDQQGRIGEIVGFLDQLQHYPSGIKAKSVKIRIDEMDVILPIDNLEIIE